MSKVNSARNTTKIKECNCAHDYQDSKHGKGQRVHNLGIKSDEWRCTVCGKKTSAK